MEVFSGNELFHHITNYVTIDSKEFEKINSYFECKQFSKKDLIFKSGDLCKHNYFIVSGCVHMFFVDDTGTNKTVQFAIENWWITDYLTYEKEESTNFYLQAAERTKALCISKSNQDDLLNNYPILEKYFRMIYQTAYGASLNKMKYLFGLSKKEIYHNFVEQFPEFAQRVPQYLIASFLNLTPEYVSEIRNQRRS